MADSKDKDSLPASNTPLFAASEKIQKINVADEIKNSFLDYSMSVIISRALPDARDGLKPSQRRILLAMHDLNLGPGRQYRKCAKICGDTSGNYHPHGEAVIYPTLVNMAQDWSMREILVDGQGNFGSPEADPPAAMRYTEARLTHLGMAMMADLEKKLARELPPDACVLAARFPLKTWTETRHDVHTVKSRGYNVNQLWEYELDPAARVLRGESTPSPR